MRKLFLATVMPGSGWVAGRQRMEQPEWNGHADFMNDLAAKGFVVLGGPINDTEAVLVIDAPDEAHIRDVFADDPWHKSNVLVFKKIREWTVLLEHGVEHKA